LIVVFVSFPSPFPRPHHVKKSAKYMTAEEMAAPDGMPLHLALKPLDDSVPPALKKLAQSIPSRLDLWLEKPGLAQTLKRLTARRGAEEVMGKVGSAGGRVKKPVGRLVRWEDLQEHR
jgi:hypothetical protein